MWDFRYVVLMHIAVMHLSYCLPPEEENILNNLQHTAIELNGASVLLDNLFEETLTNAGDVRLQKLLNIINNRSPFNPPPASDPSIAPYTYIDRELISQVDEPRRANPSTIAQGVIASTASMSPPKKKFQLSTNTQSSSSLNSPEIIYPSKFVLIKGVTGSGKTTILNQIIYSLNEGNAPYWIIRTKASDLANLLADNVNMERYISYSVAAEDYELFDMLKELNPKKIVILIDDLEKVASNHEDSFYSTIEHLKDEGVRFVINSDERVFKKLEHLSPKVWNIPELNFQETTKFLSALWQNVPGVHSRIPPMPEYVINERRSSWILGVTTILMETPIPRTPTALKGFAEMYPPYRHPYYFINEVSTPMDLTYMMDDRRLKKEVYNTIVTRIADGRFEPITHRDYGALAIANIVRRNEKPHIANGLLESIENHLAPAEILFSNPNLRPFFVEPSNNIRKIPPTHRRLYPIIGIANPSYQIDHPKPNKFEFIHADLENYFAGEFLLDLLKNYEDGDFFLQHILSEKKYARVLEFVESPEIKINEPSSERMKKILLRNKFTLTKIMDNLLIHGLENMFNRCLYEFFILEKLDIVEKYFNTEYKPHISLKRPMGMLKTEEFSDVLEKFDNPKSCIDCEMRTRLELVVENHLVDVYEAIDALEIRPRNPVEVEKLLRYALDRPHINLRIPQKIIESAKARNYPIDTNKLIFDLINKAGDVILRSAEILKFFSLLPDEVTSYRNEIFEAAAKWNSRGLMSFVERQLKVPITDSSTGKFNMKAFARALDANPSVLYTAPGWWQKMDYLMSKFKEVGFSVQEFYEATIQHVDYKIPFHDYKSPWLTVILGSEDLDLDKFASGDARDIQLKPVTLGDTLSDKQLGKMLLVPTTQWDLSEQTLALRRHFIMDKLFHQNGGASDITFLELFVNYRGVSLLQREDRVYYRHLVKNLIDMEQSILTEPAKKRILTTLIDNIGHDNDVMDVQFFIEKGLTLESSGIQTVDILEERLGRFTIKESKEISAKTRLTSTNIEYRHLSGQRAFIEENPHCLGVSSGSCTALFK